jgi:hypothetical protein
MKPTVLYLPTAQQHCGNPGHRRRAAAGSTTTTVTVTLNVAPGFLFCASRFNFLVFESFISNPAQ